MAGLISPSPLERRSRLADWLELLALVRPNGIATESDLLSIVNIDEIEDRDEETPGSDDNETDVSIVDPVQDAVIESVFDEIEYRAGILGPHYPFNISSSGSAIKYNKCHLSSVSATIYAFSLVVTCIRDGRIQSSEEILDLEKNAPNLFQACSCVAAGGYLGGGVSSFGFPRSAGNSFLPALRIAYKRVGEGIVRDSIPPGYPSDLKDGGIDIIAWRSHPDKRPGKVLMLGQVASGAKWRDKSVKDEMDSFYANWFEFVPPSASHTTPALFIPFPIYHDLEDKTGVDFRVAAMGRMEAFVRSFGIIFDRFRIVHYVEECLGPDGMFPPEVDGGDQIHLVDEWLAWGLKEIAG